jgi:1-acyl-sn-glycerol-3-phosphate acyltransferase
MNIKPYFAGDTYHTGQKKIGWFSRNLPSVAFYWGVILLVTRNALTARKGRYDVVAWHAGSAETVRILESVGCRLDITGLDNLKNLEEPCIFIANHMSTLEAFVLPSVLMTGKTDLTYVVKRSLTEYPVFKHVMQSRNPIVVDRVNPRDDLKAVMEEGVKRLRDGYSIIIFPQHTRSVKFDPEAFNSIGIKLARKAGVKVVPVALLTWAWSQGKIHKDFGPIIPSRPIHFAIGEPIEVTGKGQEAHEHVIAFIQEHLAKWGQDEFSAES